MCVSLMELQPNNALWCKYNKIQFILSTQGVERSVQTFKMEQPTAHLKTGNGWVSFCCQLTSRLQLWNGPWQVLVTRETTASPASQPFWKGSSGVHAEGGFSMLWRPRSGSAQQGSWFTQGWCSCLFPIIPTAFPMREVYLEGFINAVVMFEVQTHTSQQQSSSVWCITVAYSLTDDLSYFVAKYRWVFLKLCCLIGTLFLAVVRNLWPWRPHKYTNIFFFSLWNYQCVPVKK